MSTRVVNYQNPPINMPTENPPPSPGDLVPTENPPPPPGEEQQQQQQQPSRWHRFLLPTLDRPFLLRLATTAIIAWVFFGYLCIPALINGESMYPTYKNRAFLFCWRPRYWFASPRHGDVVMLKIAGCRVMLLKRIVALPGDTVSFKDGVLMLNGEEPLVPWARTSNCDWNLEPRTVQPGHVYVVGDNRGMPSNEHEFGEIATSRIAGAPVW